MPGTPCKSCKFSPFADGATRCQGEYQDMKTASGRKMAIKAYSEQASGCRTNIAAVRSACVVRGLLEKCHKLCLTDNSCKYVFGHRKSQGVTPAQHYATSASFTEGSQLLSRGRHSRARLARSWTVLRRNIALTHPFKSRQWRTGVAADPHCTDNMAGDAPSVCATAYTRTCHQTAIARVRPTLCRATT